MKYAAMTIIGLIFGVGSALGSGCGGENRIDVLLEEGPNAPRANLPAVPTLPPPPHPVTYPDGAYSVYGVRHQASRNWTKQVTIKAYIARAYVPMVPNTTPPRPCVERDHCLEEKPHIYIADVAGETNPENMMMVTGYASFQADIDAARAAERSGHPAAPPGDPSLAAAGLTHTTPTDFYPGAQVTVTGSLRRRASNGQADSAGLVEYTRHTTITPSPEAPPPRRH